MVYCGKPSGGCHACRARKTRCDQIPEGCTQCKKAKRTCPGYRNEGDLVFRDQSAHVIHRFKAREAREGAKLKHVKNKRKAPYAAAIVGTPESDADSVSTESSLEIVQQDRSQLSIDYALPPTLEDRAMSLFFYNYVINIHGPNRGFLTDSINLVQSQSFDDCLSTSIKAAGFAILAHSARAPSLQQNARYLYIKAIQLTNAALRSPTDVVKDSTLLTIQILSIFENITGCRKRSFKDWADHLNGATAVIKLRGRDQVKSFNGRQLFFQLTAQLMIICLQSGSSLPKHVREYMEVARQIVQTPDSSFIVQVCMARYCDLRADVRHRRITDPETIVAKYLEIDGDLLEIQTRIPPGWMYETIYTDEDSPIVYNRQYHIYYDYWIAQMWNALRSLRAMLNENIRDVLLEGFAAKPPRFTEPEYAAQFQLSRETLYQLQADILTSVPQHLDVLSPSTKDLASLVRRSPLAEDLPPQPMSGGAFLMWPIWFAGLMDISTPQVREYVVRILNIIADDQGIQQARILAKSVEMQEDLPQVGGVDDSPEEPDQAIKLGTKSSSYFWPPGLST